MWEENICSSETGELKPGTILNFKYIIKKTIGSGGFGITYQGWDTILNMPVAVKEYRCQMYTSEKEKQNFWNEARTMAKFSGNEGIVNVRDFFEENKTVYIVMEYLEGITLNQYIEANGKLSPYETFTYMKPVMEVLSKIHKEGFIHRDISPDNIMMVKEGKIKLLDFGASRDVKNTDGTITVILKQGYAPEEQYCRENNQGPWTDVYAVCATIYKCITGKTPDISLHRLSVDNLKKPSEMGIPVSQEFEQVLTAGLEVHRQNRIQSIDELIRRMEFALEWGNDGYRRTDSRHVVKEALFLRGRSKGVTPLIGRDEVLPAVKRKVFTTTADNQNFLEFCVVKETAPFASEYLMVRKFRVYGIRPKKREVPRIEVTFYIDEQKHLEVKAMDLETNRRLYIQDLFRRDRPQNTGKHASRTLSLETSGGVATPVIRKGEVLPAVKKQIFSTAADNQTAVDLCIYLGEGAYVKENELAGQFRLDKISPAKAGEPQIEVLFEMDRDEKIKVSAKNLDSGEMQSITIIK